MADLKDAILDAKYVEMIGLADFIVRDCALPDVDADGNLVSGQQEIAAAIFRWAVTQNEGGNLGLARVGGDASAMPAHSETADQTLAPVQDIAPMPVNDQGY